MSNLNLSFMINYIFKIDLVTYVYELNIKNLSESSVYYLPI